MKHLLVTLTVVLVALILGYRLAEPVSGFFFRYLRWSLAHRSSRVHGHVKSNGADIRFVSYGQGPAVVLLHGGLSNRLAWFSQIPTLVEAGRQVIVLDVRGHGGSSLGSRELNYHLLAEDVIRVLDRLNVGQADVVGWSDGGNTALLLAHDFPERVRRMVVISANFNPDGLTPDEQQDAHALSTGAGYWITRWWTGAGNGLRELERRVKRMWRTYPQLQPADLEGINIPVLVVVGQHDIVRVVHAQEMAERIPLGKFLVVPGGHATPVTHPVKINTAITGFLEHAVK